MGRRYGSGGRLIAIHIDVLARLHERQAEREADKLADKFDKAGFEAGQRFGDNLSKGIAARSPKVQKALNNVKDATERVTAAQAAHNKVLADYEAQEERLAIASEKVTAARNREQNASLGVWEAEYRLAQARKSANLDAEKEAILIERVEAAKRNEENASLAVRKAIEDEHRAKRDADAENERLITSSDRLTSARRKEADAHRSAATELRKFTNDQRNARNVMENLNESIQDIGTNAFRFGRGMATIGTAPAAIGLIKVAQLATAASQSILLLPAAAATATAGIGTLQLATAGFADTIKDIRDPDKFAEGLALLGPNAQQAALSIRNLLPVFDQLKYATQDAFFAGIGEQIHRLTNEFMPEIQTLTTSIAGTFNQMMTGLADQLMTPTNMANIQIIFDNIAQTFTALGPGAQAFTQAMIDLTTVGSGFMPQLAASISTVAQSFADFISEAAASGDLARWMDEGIAAVFGLTEVLWDLGTVLFEAFAPDNMAGVQQLIDDLHGVTEIVGILVGDTQVMGDAWREELDGMTGMAAVLRDAIMNIPLALNIVGANFIEFANTAKDALINGPIKALNALLKGFNAIPGPLRGMFGLPAGDLQIPEVPDIPNVPARNILEGGMLPTRHEAPAGPFAPEESNRQRGDQPRWTAPDGTRMKWEAGKGWVPVAAPRRTPFGNRQAGLGPYPGPFGVPAPPGPGGKPSDRERRDAIIASLDPSLYRVDPYAQVPGLPAVPGILKPGDPALYQAPGYRQDPQAVLEAQQNVERAAHDLEEARKERLALERDNEATAEQINDAKWKELQEAQNLQREQADLSEKLRGSTREIKDRMGELGVALDPDLGLSKGLAGFAEFLTKFIGNIVAAPTLARLDAIVQADPLKGGYGMMGIRGAQNIAAGRSPILGRPLTAEQQAAYYEGTGGTGGGANASGNYTPYSNGQPMPLANIGAPTMLRDTGSTPSGPQSRTAAALVEQFFGSQLRGTIGGSRDTGTAPGTHDAGLSIDIPIGPDQMDLGDQIAAFLQENAAALGLKYTIWRNQGKYPGGGGFTAGGHMNHIDAHFNGQGGAAAGMFTTPGATGYNGPSSASFAGGSIPLPLPVTIVGGGAGGGGFGWGGGAKPTGVGTGVGARIPAAGGLAGSLYQGADGSWHSRLPGWEHLIQRESSGINQRQGIIDANSGGNEAEGLFQITPQTWASHGGTRFAPSAIQASPQQQAQIAEAIFNANPSGGDWGMGLPGRESAPQLQSELRGGSWGGGGSVLPGTGMPQGLPFAQGPQLPGLTAPGGIGVGSGLGNGLLPAPGIGSAVGAGGPSGWGPTKIGGVGAPTGPGGPGGVGITPGGTLDTAIGAAAAGLDVLAPGAGQAAQTGIKLANRAIQYAGQLAAIGVSGLMETFLPTGGSELANNSWLTRVAGGLAGAIPQVPNIAGGKSGTGNNVPGPLDPNQVQHQPGKPGAAGPGNINVEYNNVGATEDRAGRDLTHHLGNMYQGAAR